MSEEKDWFEGRSSEPRPVGAAWLGWFVLLLAIIAIVTWASNVRAEEVFRIEAVEGVIALRLSEEPCTNADVLTGIIRLGGGPMLPKFKAATLTWEGKDWASCWIDVQGVVYSFDEEGAPLQPIPRTRFVERTL